MKTPLFVLSFSSLALLPNSFAETAEHHPAQVVEHEPVWKSNPGPWGDLDIRSIYLEAPASMLAEMPKPNSVPRWCFPGADETSLRTLFKEAAIPASVQERLFSPQRMLAKDGVLTLFPILDDLEALTTDQRSVVYAELAKSPLNEFQCDPVYVLGGDVEDWLRGAHLSDELKNVVKRMTWRRGRALVFSDVSALLSHTHSDTDVTEIFQLMTRVRTLVADLMLPAGIDWKPLAKYWTAGRESTDTLPMLVSAAERNSISSLDITHLLPPIPRRRIYSYPTTELISRGRMPDCHWTSLNFFNTMPQDYFLDTRLAAAHLVENYNQVEPPYQFGDVLCVQNEAKNVAHSCVYVADDMVYTKNGENTLMPWLLMWMKDVEDIYLTSPEWHIQGYRLKPVTAVSMIK